MDSQVKTAVDTFFNEEDNFGSFKSILFDDNLNNATLDSLKVPLLQNIEELYEKAYVNGDDTAKKEFHGILYLMNISKIGLPWKSKLKNVNHHLFIELKSRMEALWDSFDRDYHSEILAEIPKEPEKFKNWVLNMIETHPSNVIHPLFKFISEEASLDQLTEFFHQEGPMDLHFVDVLTLMMPGIYGEMKIELASNFWDEMGCGQLENVHRQMRIKFMDYLNIDENDHLDNINYYCWEELALANLYFQGAYDRNRLIQLIGNMLATETMVPGRVDLQVNGWKRVGVADSELGYLSEHVTVDVEHAEGWLKNLVLPLVVEHSDMAEELAFGALRRLKAAEDVCTKMMIHLKNY